MLLASLFLSLRNICCLLFLSSLQSFPNVVQELVARGIELRRLQEDATSQASAYERRVGALEATVKRCSSENSTQVRELEATVRILKGKSDLHAQVLEARSALQVGVVK